LILGQSSDAARSLFKDILGGKNTAESNRMLQSHGFASALVVTGWFGVATHIFFHLFPSLKQQPRNVPIVKQGLTLIIFQEFVNPCKLFCFRR